MQSAPETTPTLIGLAVTMYRLVVCAESSVAVRTAALKKQAIHRPNATMSDLMSSFIGWNRQTSNIPGPASG
jgi:hypothetical protein